jgi:hypothetical protein
VRGASVCSSVAWASGGCCYHAEAGLERWVGWGLLAHNLCQISRSVVAESAR